jgi:NAD-dependent SIR2 family protein deacetylase
MLCQWIKESKHCITFTGAGISTSTGIRDFRSGMNTVLKSGPGKWELQAKQASKQASKSSLAKVNVLKVIPSVAHMVVVKLHAEGLVKFTVSQNVDGLHLRSGIRADQLAELHGNTNLERCIKCGAKYLRDFRTRNAQKVHNHRTGRFCDNLKCRGPLVDSIINFGEDLPEEDLERSFDEAEKCDLCIVLGSSLRVTPAADIPANVIRKGGKVVICNLQKTPLNDRCAMEIHAKIDEVMVGLAKRLGLEIPQFTVKRRLAIDVTEKNISIQGLDFTLDTPYSFLRQTEVKLMQKRDGKYKEITKDVLTKEPYTITLPKTIKFSPQNPLKGVICLGFQGHYGEPDFTLRAEMGKAGRTVYLLSYNISDGSWNVENSY